MNSEVMPHRAAGFLLATALLVSATQTAFGETNRLVGSGVPVAWRPGDRVLVLAPHPGDEVLGCGLTLSRAAAEGVPVRVVFLTCGEYDAWSLKLYRSRLTVRPEKVSRIGPRRLGAARTAAKRLGLRPDAVVFLGYPDFGGLALWCAHWAEAMSFRSMLTRTWKVTCAEALRPEAPFKGETLLDDLKMLLRDFRPTRVLVSHPADHHPDHQALYLFTRIALWDLADEVHAERLPFLIHYPDWPEGDLRADGVLKPPRDLAAGIAWCSFSADRKAVRDRRRAAEGYAVSDPDFGKHVQRFAGSNDLFGDFPEVVLTAEEQALDVGRSSRVPAKLLTKKEKRYFVGIPTRSVQQAEETLRLKVGLTRPLEDGVGLSLYVFGYRPDQPFGQMPKIHVRVTPFSCEVWDQSHRLPPGVISVKRTGSEIEVRVPQDALGWPARVLTGARTYLNDVPLDGLPWRVLEIARSVPSGTPTE